MKKLILALAFYLIQMECLYSQITFEEGYFVNEKNQKISCMIQDLGWVNNPESFDYKISTESGIETANIHTTKEFGIGHSVKYVRRLVKIDLSKNKIEELSTRRDPEFIEKEVFLEVLVEGSASLFKYQEGDLTRFYFSTDTTETVPLIFKQYKSDQDELKENDQFKQQLFVNLGVGCFKSEDFERLKYYSKDLIRLFVEFNRCTESEFVDFSEDQPRMIFNLQMKAGFNRSSLLLKNFRASSVNTEFDIKNAFKLGLESEFVLPVRRYKWALVVEPTFQYFKNSQPLDYETVSVNYQYLDLALGIRHYFYFDNNSKFFLNGFVLFSFDLNSSIDYSSGTELDIKTYPNFAAGFGYQFNDKFSVECRYQTRRQILADYVNWDAQFNALSLVFGFVIFNQ